MFNISSGKVNRGEFQIMVFQVSIAIDSQFKFKGTVMQIEKSLVNNCLRVSKIS